MRPKKRDLHELQKTKIVKSGTVFRLRWREGRKKSWCDLSIILGRYIYVYCSVHYVHTVYTCLHRSTLLTFPSSISCCIIYEQYTVRKNNPKNYMDLFTDRYSITVYFFTKMKFSWFLYFFSLQHFK